MDKTFTKHLFFLAILLFTITGAFAQTITVGTVDPGPYGQGSSIAVPINVNTTSGCVNSGNTYNLYLSDASGNFTPGTLIGSYTGVYATFVNGVIPNGTAAGAGYKVEVKSTNPVVTSTVSSAFTISGNTGVTASLTESETVSPGVFGRCVGSTSAYSFTSSAGGTVTASFFNEGSQSYEASNVSVPYSFTPNTANYTVTGKSVNASGTVGTYGYELVNNVVVNPFSPFGTPFVCIPSGGSGDLQFIMPITGPGGIINNYPGTTYTVNWGDGTSTTFTYCQIVALGGILVHTYVLPSCGQTSTGGATNSLTVVSHAISPYCGEVASAATTSAKVIITPVTKFSAPSVACVGTALTIPNTSDPGPDYSIGAASTCAVNANAKYDWTLDGVAVAGYQGVPLSKSFILAATTTHGTHTLTLHAETPAIGCASTDYTQTICFEDPPQPVFTMPTPLCVTGGPVSPTNTSTVDNTCAVPQYIWTVTGPAAVGYAGGTNANSAIPQFVFSAAGFYTVQLGISSSGCGVVNAAPQTIAVDAAPTTTMSPDATICGNNLTFTFDPSQTTTKTVVSGTTLPTPTTFSWVITGGAYSFLGGTNATSQYPQILFADYATYTIQVTNTNSCGSSTASQTLTFVQAPSVSAGGDQTVCASNPAVVLAGTVTGSYTSYQWVGGTGTFSPNRTTANATYTPSNTEITAGTVTLTFKVNNTAVPAPCNVVTDQMKITITPTVYITSSPTDAACSGQALTYLITASNPLATFTWTSSLTSGTATGFTASGSGPNITDVITNSGNTDAVVTYNILPTLNGCPGTPFVLNVTIHPLPTITAVPVNNPICNNQPADIVFTSNVASTTYTWTSTASANISGNTNQATALVTSSIQDILSNSGTIAGTVTYTVTPYNGTCPGPPVVTTITVEPTPIASNAGPNDEVCASTTYTLQGNNPAPGTGKWTVVGSPAGVTFNDDTNPNAIASGLVPGNIYQFTWTITDYPSCPSTSSTVSITIDKSPVGGTTGTDAHVCSGSNVGTITLAGQFGSVVRWESSIDNGTTWQPIANTGTTQPYSNLTQTTLYRAMIHNGVCPDVASTVTTITVDAPPNAANAGPNDEVCNTTTYTLQGNNPSPSTGKWTVVGSPAGVTFDDDTKPNAVVSGLVPGTTYQFTWTVSNTASCPPTTSTVTIQIDKAPVGGTTGTDAHVCSGTNAGSITLAGQFGTIVSWESSVDNGTSWQTISNTSTTFSYANLTQTTQYRAVIHNGVCPDAKSSITTITVDAPPIASVAGPDDEVCANTTYTLQGNNPAPGTGKWTVIGNPPGVSFNDDTNPNAVVSGLVPGSTYQFTWTISNTAACPSTSSTVNISIDKAPVGGTTGTDAHVCLGTNAGTITLTGQFGTIVRWESSIDNGATWQAIANATTIQSYTNLTQTTQYRVMLHNGICPDAPSSVTTITVDQPPIASNAGPDAVVCNTTIYTLQGNNPAPGTGKWTVAGNPPGVTFNDDTSPNAVVSGLVPGTAYQFTWTISNTASCPSTSSSVNITVDKAPVGGTTLSDTHVCSGTNVGVITLTGQFGTVLRWESSVDNGATWQTITNITTTLNYLNLTQTTQYRAFLHNTSTCPDVPSTVTTITVDPPPTASNPGPNDEVCSTNTYTLQGNNPSPSTGKWTMVSGPSAAVFSDDTNPNAVATGLVPGTYVFRWTITNTAACPSNANDVTIIIDKAPIGGTTTSDATVCAGTNGGPITLAGQFGTIVKWESSIDNGATWQPIFNTSVTLNYSNLTQTTKYRAVLHNGVCPDVRSSITTITVDQPPIAAVAGPDNEVCSSATYTLQGNNPAPGTGTWTMVSGPSTATFSNATSPNAVATSLVTGVYVFRWTITNTAACPPTHDDVTITIDQAPVGGTTSSDATVCAGTNAGLITLTGQFGTIVRWESSIDNGASWQTVANTTANYVYSNLTQTTQYRVWLHNGICPDVPSSLTTITVDQPPIAAIAGPNDEVCSSSVYTLQGNNPAPNNGKWTMVSGPSAAIFSDDTKANAVVSGLVPGVYVFRWTISNTAACAPTHDDVTITIDKAPIGGTTTSDATVCAGSNGAPITLAGQFGSVVRWESSTDNGASWQIIANTTTTLTYSNLTQTTQYRAMLHNGICPDVPSTVTTITVDQPPIAAIAGPDEEICSTNTYTLQGNNPAPNTGKWTMLSGPSTAIFSDDTKANAIATGLVPGVYVFRWTISNTAACPSTHDDVTITIDPAPVGGTTSSDATVCQGSNAGLITLAGQMGNIVRWESSTDNGASWQPIASTSSTISYANLTQTTQYHAVVHNGVCPDVASSVTTITVDLPPVAANAGPDDEVCNAAVYTLKGNTPPGPNKGQWSMVTGPSLPTFADPTDPQAVVSGLMPGTYTFRWTISNTAACPPTHDDVIITIDKAPVGGNTSSNETVCSGGNSGQIHLASQFGSVARWEFSVDNGNTWQPIANTTTVQSYLNLTQTTQYRAVVHNGITCPDSYSTPTIITVNPQTPIADAGQNYNLCNQTSTILKGNNPGSFVGAWTQTGGPAVTIADPNNYTTSVTGMTGGNVYKFTWTIKGLPPCGDTFAEITIGVSSDITPSFAMDQNHGCGPVVVTFTNTSTPAPTGTFVWNFGDGSPQVTAINPPAHTFQPSNDGTEAVYEVTMIPTSNCGSQAPYVAYVKVSSAKPVASFNPAQTSACGTFTLSAQNLSPGNNAQYDFYLKDANGNIVQHLTYPDTRDAVFQPMTVTQQTYYSMYLVVIDKCGNQATSPAVNIPVSPSSLISNIQIKGNASNVCIGSPVTFQNTSTGGDRFTITIYDSNKKPILTMPAGTGDINYTPTATGAYYVSITAGNTGCGDAPESALVPFTVYPIPAPSFTWTADQNFNVTFNNTTPDVANIPAASLVYKWDFGDGSTFDPSYIPATHHFDFSKAPFTVTLTATTPGTDCSGVTSQSINITFKGNLFLPNAFIPASSDKNLNTFIAKGFGMKTWRMQIFNNFGQLVWETTKLDNNGAPVDGWDGTYKGRIVEQGVYIWQISATLLNGEEWKGMSYHNSSPSKTGAIHLIR